MISFLKREKISEGVSEGVNLLLEVIKEERGHNSKVLVAKVGRPAKTVERWLKLLREEGKIEYRGSSKTGGYYVKE